MTSRATKIIACFTRAINSDGLIYFLRNRGAIISTIYALIPLFLRSTTKINVTNCTSFSERKRISDLSSIVDLDQLPIIDFLEALWLPRCY